MLKASPPRAIGKAHLVRWVVNMRVGDRIRVVAAVKLDVKSGLDVNEIMRSGRMIEAAAMAQANVVSQDKNRSEVLTARSARKEEATERAAGDMVNGKASALVAKEQGSDRAVSLVNHVRGANHASPAKASLTAALATKAAHQDRDGKNVIDEAETEVQMSATMDESEFVSLRTSRMAT